MRRDCLQLAKVAFKKDSKKEEEKTKRGFKGLCAVDVAASSGRCSCEEAGR